MKKSLLILSAALLALSAAASTPIYFKHANVMVSNFQGSGKDLRCGNGLCYDPSSLGSVEDYDTPIKAYADGDGAALGDYGFQFETRTWKKDTPENECIQAGEVILAFEYKSNTVSSKAAIYTIDLGAGGVLNGGGCWTGGTLLTVSDDWQTCYLLCNALPEGWAQAGKMNDTSEDWLWIRFTDINHIKNPDFEMYYMHPRLMSVEEAQADLEKNFNPKSDIETSFSPTNDGFVVDTDESGNTLYMLSASADGSFNPVMHSVGMLYSLPESHDTFAFDYQTTGSFSLNLYMWSPGMALAGSGTISDEYELESENWGTFTINCKQAIATNNFAQTFASGNYLWLQCPPTERDNAEDNLFTMVRPRWTSAANLSGIEDITADNNAEAVYYNLQGVKVANPANGLYIKKQGNTTSKVLVK